MTRGFGLGSSFWYARTLFRLICACAQIAFAILSSYLTALTESSKPTADTVVPMVRKSDRDGGARESRLASGWTVASEATELETQDSDIAGAPRRPAAEVVGEADAETAIAAGAQSPTEAQGAAETPHPTEAQAAASDPDDEGATVDFAPEQRSAGALILFGLLGGLYLLYTWVWLSWASAQAQLNALIAEASGTLGSLVQQLVYWAAPFAPALWFVSVLVLHRGARSWRIALWLLIGAVILVPLPMFEFGASS